MSDPMPEHELAAIRHWLARDDRATLGPAGEGIIRRLLEEVTRLRAGEDPTPIEPNVWPTPGQWVALFNSKTAEERLHTAEVVLEQGGRSVECFTRDHAGEIDRLRAELAAAAEREQRVRALHTPVWTDSAGIEYEHTVVIYGGPPEGHTCRTGRRWDNCQPCPESPEDDEHYVLACRQCGGMGDEGEAMSLLWPCPTYAALDGPNDGGEE